MSSQVDAESWTTQDGGQLPPSQPSPHRSAILPVLQGGRALGKTASRARPEAALQQKSALPCRSRSHLIAAGILWYAASAYPFALVPLTDLHG